jgi:uncharacterized RDD family membrane protein YckC
MENPYQAPSARVEDFREPGPELASRSGRFGAAFLDAIIMMAVLLPLEFVTGFWQQAMEAARNHERLPFTTTMMWSAIGIAAFALIQGYPLVKDAQTWGKKAASLRIVSVTGGRASVKQLAIRYVFYLALGVIPVVGPYISLLSVLLIFRSDRRCGHDLVAGTRVVQV